MPDMKLLRVPKPGHAHFFSADHYKNVLESQKNALEITYIASGSLTFNINGEKYVAENGCIVCNRRLTPTLVEAPAYHGHYTVLFYNFEVENYNLPALIPNPSSKAFSLIDKIISTKTLYPKNQLACVGLFIQLLGELESICNSNGDNAYNPYMRKIKKYIYDHMHEKITQREIAEYLNITPEYLCTVFKRSEGISLIQYINRLKLLNIKTVMENESITLRQAAEMYGYSDPNYVSHLYKKHFGYNISEMFVNKNTAHSIDI